MSVEEVSHRSCPTGRAVAAVLLTAIFAPMLFSLGAMTLAAYLRLGQISKALFFELFPAIWFFGAVVTLPCAIAIGVAVELPKLRSALSRGPAVSSSLRSSILAAALIFSTIWVTDVWLAAGTALDAEAITSFLDYLALFSTAAILVGVCSAGFWYLLVRRTHSSSAASSEEAD